MRTQAEINEVWFSQYGEADLHGFQMDAPFYMPAGSSAKGWNWPTYITLAKREGI